MGIAKRSASLTLAQASTIVDKALECGRRQRMEPLTVVVLDSGGHPVALKREDGAGILRADMAIAKAYGAIGLGVSGRTLRDMAEARPFFTNALAAVAGGRMLPVPGGVLILADDDRVIGAVGISGDTSENDERAAIEGIKGVALRPDPEQPATG
jgi:uncharacterized protein GlcG (DUF336 family)